MEYAIEVDFQEMYGRTDVVGKWRILKGTPANPDAIIFQLDPEQPGKTLSFLAGDENVLFFLKNELSL